MEAVSLNTKINFRANEEVSPKELNSENIKSDFVKTPEEDKFEKNNAPKTKKKRHLVRNICLGVLSAIVLTYGSIVLKRKLSKPSFEEVQRCFKEIFEKDLSADEVKGLLSKYKEICKEGKTDDFVKKMIEQLKTDYGIEKVKTDLKVKKLADSKLSTAMNQTEYGTANPLGEIKIMPNTHSDNIIRSIQGETFATGFHEMKHMKQFADAYRANPDEFAKAILNNKETMAEIDAIVENIKKEVKRLANENKVKYPHLTLEQLEKQILKNSGYANEADIKTKVIEANVEHRRKMLDERFGLLDRFKEGTEEYKKGMEYIRGYEQYPDPSVDYEAYRSNILEKEAWNVGDLAKKIYKYTSSIWKL